MSSPVKPLYFAALSAMLVYSNLPKLLYDTEVARSLRKVSEVFPEGLVLPASTSPKAEKPV